MWVGEEIEAVLLGMKIRPFLSHKREEQRNVRRLRDALRVYGAGGWKDTDDLRLGARTREEIANVIRSETGGFIWWGTRGALNSSIITQLEIPEALDRARRGEFPIVPVFIDLHPDRNRRLLQSRIPLANELLGFNGVVAGRDSPSTLCRRIARRYVEDAVLATAGSPISAAFRALSAPTRDSNVTFDWRGIFDGYERQFQPGGMTTAIDAIRNFRTSVQRREHTPLIEVDADLPLPLAYMVGYEWRETTRLRVTVRQRTRSSYKTVSLTGVAKAPDIPPQVTRLRDDGPAVIAISCGRPLQHSATHYADTVGASELVALHVDGMLDARLIRGVASKGAEILRELSDRGRQKHLLILGPSALAMALGAASNAVGPVTLPFWHEPTMGYVNAISVPAP